MAIREILKLGNSLLREKCDPIADPCSLESKQLAKDLEDTVRHSFATIGYGRAIAAPQIGSLKRMIFLSVPSPLVLVNPEVVKKSEETMIVWDACLSFLSIFMKVRRHREITVSYQDLNGCIHILEAGAKHDLAELLQHEIDHLDGILALDRIEDIRTVCSREEFERQYKDCSPYKSQQVAI